eukprot:EG_transcript_66109
MKPFAAVRAERTSTGVLTGHQGSSLPGVATSQTRTVRSEEHDAMRVPATAQWWTASVCPGSVASTAPLAASHTLRVLSWEAETSLWAEGLKAQPWTMAV